MKEEIRIEFERLALTQLSDIEKELVAKARSASQTAYAPYSKFRVGAALVLDNGQIVTGSNQENIAFPSGLCAERVALFSAGANYADQKVQILVIVASGDLLKPGSALSPCGGCRQVMCETEMRQGEPFKVILMGEDDVASVFESAGDLLPLTFGK